MMHSQKITRDWRNKYDHNYNNTRDIKNDWRIVKKGRA